MNFKEGVILSIDKPYAMSSFGALAHIRYLLTKKMRYKVKVGHAGTLDPLATGVLILCTGKKTKEIETLMAHIKEYVATLQLGASTASHDMEHPVDEVFPTEQITRERIEQVLTSFVGDVQQVPPVYSAVCVNGKRAYQLSRKGKDFEIKAKTVHIEEIELLHFDEEMMQMSIRVVCGKGTYIRSLARDIGEALDSAAYLTSLCRTRVGDISLSQCITLEQFPKWLEQQDLELLEQ
ncbi:MAG: tRNA pseudouridine(55) synthase TruB [Prevotella sp.]|nr:tRNA pseudouridine(55) synthase TruB [Prevotella sp.]MBP5355703.1 tRNA pseudouridine(55) synthase TruB [Prevotella sp.]